MKNMPDTVISWTSLKEAMPENNDEILVVHNKRIKVAAVWNGIFRDWRERKIVPAFWAKFPEMGD